MKETYTLQLDFDLSSKTYNNLNDMFNILKENKHIFVYDLGRNKEKYIKMAAEEGIDTSKYPVYIETSTELQGVFVESEQFWVENYMLSAFYYSDKMPYIERLV